MIWTTVSSWSCFCWLYRAPPSLAAKNIINLILVLTVWWLYHGLLSISGCFQPCSEKAGWVTGVRVQGLLTRGQIQALPWTVSASLKGDETGPRAQWGNASLDPCIYVLSHVQLFVTSWTIACQAPLSTGFSRQEYWSCLPFPTPGDLPDPGIEPASLVSPALAGRSFTTEPLGKLR